jgi:dephospho-CoA kinase
MKKEPRLIGLTGTNGSGKGELAAYLQKRGYAYASLSDVIREELAAAGKEITRDNLIAMGNALRERYGPDVLARRVTARVRGKAVIDSVRNIREVEYLKKQKGFVFWAVDAPAEVRFERARARGRDESAATLEEFKKKEEEEMKGNESAQQLAACMAMADRLFINSGSLEDLYAKVEEAL